MSSSHPTTLPGAPAQAAETVQVDGAVLCSTRDGFIRETRKQCKRGVELIKIADSTWGDVQTVADDEIAAVVNEAHRHNVKVAIHSRGSTQRQKLKGLLHCSTPAQATPASVLP